MPVQSVIGVEASIGRFRSASIYLRTTNEGEVIYRLVTYMFIEDLNGRQNA